MPIQFRCSGCDRLLQAPDGATGQTARCPECGVLTTIPLAGGAAASPAVPPPPVPPARQLAETSPFLPPMSDLDPNNPYAAPSMAGSPFDYGAPIAAMGGPITPTRISINDVLDTTWRIFKRQWQMVVGAQFIVLVIGQLCNIPNYLSGPVGQAAPRAGVALAILAFVLQMVVGTWIGAGNMLFMLKIARGQPVNIGEIFSGARFILPMIGFSIIWYTASLAGLLLLIVGAFIILMRLSPGVMFIVDGRAGPLKAVNLAWECSRGNTLRMFGLAFVSMGVMILGFFLCCFGYFFSLGFIMLMYAVAYLSMTGQPIARYES